MNVYGGDLVVIAAMTSLLWRFAVAERLVADHRAEDQVRAVTAKLNPSLGLYAVAIGIGLLAPRAAVFLCLAIALYLLIPFRIIIRHARRRSDS